MRLTAVAVEPARANGWPLHVVEEPKQQKKSTLVDAVADGQTAPSANCAGSAKERKEPKKSNDAKAKDVKQNTAGEPKNADAVAASSQEGAKPPLNQQAPTETGKLTKMDGTSPFVARVSDSAGKKRGRSDGPEPTNKFALGRPLPSAVQAEVGAVVGLLAGLFGDKKPLQQWGVTGRTTASLRDRAYARRGQAVLRHHQGEPPARRRRRAVGGAPPALHNQAAPRDARARTPPGRTGAGG